MSPAHHEVIPSVGFVVVSVIRKEDESPRHFRTTSWSIVDDLAVIEFNTSTT
jgi:hypothetical protein